MASGLHSEEMYIGTAVPAGVAMGAATYRVFENQIVAADSAETAMFATEQRRVMNDLMKVKIKG